MTSSSTESTVLAVPAAAQILVDLKGADPTAVSAFDALRQLLGFGDRLLQLKRRRLLELALDPRVLPSPERIRETIGAYLHTTTDFWNPNKERAWVRCRRLEASDAPGFLVEKQGALSAAPFGQPEATSAAWDHLLVWPREGRSAPADLAERMPAASLLGAGAALLYSVRWRDDATAEERASWTEAIGEVRSRRQGFLVQPHFQDHRRYSGALPIPLFGGGGE